MVALHYTARLTPCPSVTQAEDPEKVLDQVVTEMQEDLIKMRQATAQVRSNGLSTPHATSMLTTHSARFLPQVMASQKQLEAKYKQAQDTAVCPCMDSPQLASPTRGVLAPASSRMVFAYLLMLNACTKRMPVADSDGSRLSLTW